MYQKKILNRINFVTKLYISWVHMSIKRGVVVKVKIKIERIKDRSVTL